MSASLISPPKRILVIGPMSADVADKDGMPLSQHIPNIAAALERVLERLQRERDDFPECQVLMPRHQPGPIPKAVFSDIMHCDGAIADMTSHSPSVNYEVALLHANGIPVIYLEEPPFYLKDEKFLIPKSYSVEDLELTLSEQSFFSPEEESVIPQPSLLEAMVKPAPGQKFSNPFSHHFSGVHLINVAATTGVATGYYYNYARWVLREGSVFYDHREFKKLIVIKPSRLNDVEDTEAVLRERFGVEKDDKDGQKTRELPRFSYFSRGFPRRFSLQHAGRYIIDYPTPISSLTVSRQYRAMLDYARENRQQTQAIDDNFLSAFEKRLIDIFFQSLEDLIYRPDNGCNEKKLLVLPIKEAVKLISSGA